MRRREQLKENEPDATKLKTVVGQAPLNNQTNFISTTSSLASSTIRNQKSV